MSTASAPGVSASRLRPVPPQRGSFPMDRDGDCLELAKKYLECVKLVDGVNAPNCRLIAKNYLECRMSHGLMDRDEMKNLGFKSDEEKK